MNYIKLASYTVTPAARKAIIIGLFLLWLKQFAGLVVMVYHASQVFTASGSSITPNMAAIVIGGVQLFGTYTSSLLVDRVGRLVKSFGFMYIVQKQHTVSLLDLTYHFYSRNWNKSDGIIGVYILAITWI